MRIEKKTIGSVLFGILIVICGIAQVAAGTIFIVLLDKVLKTTSNIWIGILNISFGIILIITESSKERNCLKLGISVGLIFLNVGNLLLLEFGEFRLLLPPEIINHHLEQGNGELLKTAYLSTVIPTILIILITFLAAEYRCCLLIDLKRNSPKNVKDGMPEDQNFNYNWVFKDVRESSSDLYHWESVDSFVDNSNTEMLNTEMDDSRNSSLNDSNVPLHTFSKSCYVTVPSIPRCEPLSHKAADVPQRRTCADYPLDDHNRNNADEELTNANSSNIRNSVGTTSSLAGTGLNCAATQLHLSLVDRDSLIYLGHLELLARQWRFQAQHRAIERRVSLRMGHVIET